MSLFHSSKNHHRVGSTTRIEGFSDAVIAIIMTLLVIELHIPEVVDTSFQGVMQSLQTVWPQVTAFAASFLALAVFWVNHHHFFHELDHGDAKLMWYNNLLLFFLSLVPFTTAFISEYPMIGGVLSVYAFNLFLAASAFAIMSCYAMFRGDLLDNHITEEQRIQHYRRNYIGVAAYGLAAVLGPFLPLASMVLIIFVPLYYITPRLMHNHLEFDD